MWYWFFRSISLQIIVFLVMTIIFFIGWEYGYNQGYEMAMSDVLLKIVEPYKYFLDKFHK